MKQTFARADLAAEIDTCGFYPDLVMDSIELALGDQDLRGFLVHHEATFATSEIHRHLTVLALTPSRLLIGHTDENPMDGQLEAISSVEAIPLTRLTTVVLTRVVQKPEVFAAGGARLFETWLTLGWGGMRRLDLDHADCGNPECTAEHGYVGTSAADDLTIRMGEASDGPESTARLVQFAALLQRSIGQ